MASHSCTGHAVHEAPQTMLGRPFLIYDPMLLGLAHRVSCEKLFWGGSSGCGPTAHELKY